MVQPDLPPNVWLERGTSLLAHTIARRVVSQQNHDLDDAARRLVSSAPGHGIDFTFSYATLDGSRTPPVARQACLGVVGAGRTAMLYLSEPARGTEPTGEHQARAERALCIDGVCNAFARERAGQVVLAQSLPDPDDRWSVEALMLAGFQSVGTLLYMRRHPRADDRPRSASVEPPSLPDGLSLVPCGDLSEDRRTPTLIAAMDTSYEETLDCPALCGLRSTPDILLSHKATGQHDPNLWWLVMRGDAPLACLFLSACPEQKTVELVYLGLGKAVRGQGLGRALMQYGIAVFSGLYPGWPMTCAVDERNTPAVRLYDTMGFRSFARRVGLVRPLWV